MSFYKALYSLYMSHTAFFKGYTDAVCVLLVFFILFNFFIIFSNSVCMNVYIFYKNMKAVEFLFLIFTFVHVCVCMCVLFYFYRDSYTLKRNFISF